MRDSISEHITFSEATKSQEAVRKNIANIPDVAQLSAMKLIAEKVFEPLRKHFDKAIFISSFFRSPELNRAIGGSTTSQHCTGEALDLDADIFGGITNSQIFDYVRMKLDFDQLIWEFGDNTNPAWVHVSYKRIGNRKEILKAIKIEGKTQYIKF